MANIEIDWNDRRSSDWQTVCWITASPVSSSLGLSLESEELAVMVGGVLYAETGSGGPPKERERQ